MIVRKYGRRNRSITGSYSASASDDLVSDGFGDPLSQESPQDIFDFTFSPQDSTNWSFDPEPFSWNSSQESRQLPVLPPRKEVIGGSSKDGDGFLPKSKKVKIGKDRNAEFEVVASKKLKSKEMRSVPATTSTATLMETQEFGEMMEHLDEVNFSLDGLRKGQPVRVRRASLLSLLSICENAQRRRLLRTHGLARTIIDDILGLTFDDSPSNLAAAALFYILTCDGQDDHPLDSPSCINFLIRLLKPLTSNVTKNKAPTIGSKLLALRKDADILQDANKGVDSTSAEIMSKVEEVLVNSKEMKSRCGDNQGIVKPELSPKWIALLTMEKACLSSISLEDTSGTVRKAGGNFKEKLRELGGLDAVFEITRNIHYVMEGWLEPSSSSPLESKNSVDLESLLMLMKCLKITENATFLSKDNQSHLLGMMGNFSCQQTKSFTKLILRVVKILSGVSLSRSSSGCSGTVNASKLPLMTNNKGNTNEIISISSSQSSMEWISSQSSQGLSDYNPEAATTFLADTCLLRMRDDSSTSGSCSGTSRNSTFMSNKGSNSTFGIGKRSEKINKVDLVEDSQDPFAFDDDDFEPTKWDMLSKRKEVPKTQKRKVAVQKREDSCQPQPILSQQESSNTEKSQSSEASCSPDLDAEKSNLLLDCLLTGVKVLMNLTNDNPEGCQQIAACGGLETLASLIASHFPQFSSHLPPFNELREDDLLSKSSLEVDPQADQHLTDQELDLLVAILGLLVNLVEKDGRNRSRLAASSVSLPGQMMKGLDEEGQTAVIPLLCSIFLANQGAGEAAEEGKALTWDDEDALLQGEREAEKMIVEAYSALLLAFLSTESNSVRKTIAECLPNHKLAILVPVLERFVEFHLTLDMISPETHTTVLEVIESCRLP